MIDRQKRKKAEGVRNTDGNGEMDKNRGGTYDELEGVDTLALLSRDNAGLDNLDRASTATVTSSHFAVHLVHSAVEGQITVLFEHIVRAGAGVVTKPDTVHLQDVRVLFGDLHEKGWKKNA